MTKIVFGLSLCIASSLSLAGQPATGANRTIRANTKVAGIEVGGMTVDEAQHRVRVWWEEQKVKPLELHTSLFKAELPKMKPSELGITIDDEATVARLPQQDTNLESITPNHDFDPVLKSDGFKPEELEALIAKNVGKPRKARAIIYQGQIFREPEITGAELSEVNLLDEVGKAIKTGQPVELPIVQGPKTVSDEQLGQITDVITSFSTHFPRGQVSRNSNIKLAASLLNGTVLLPGEKLSFNGTVGERTIKRGFKLAGVYKNGKHDTGIGGGICQVSTTMYNACLFANVKILRRSNHSMPVAYVPLGRDATVDWGNLDLVIENDFATPIAISSAVTPGQLTFRVLGKKDPSISVKLEAVGGKSWEVGTQTIVDPKLKPGEKEVVEKGSRGHSITTYKLIYKNGVLLKKELLNHSYYGGGERIVAVGPGVPTAPGIGAIPVNPPVVRTTIGHR